MEALLTLENLSKYYVNGQNVVAGLNKINLSFHRGEFVAITGESGSGKSTLAHILGGVLPYEDGELLLRGKPTSHFDSTDWENYRRENISFISQNYGILTGATVLDNVVSALLLAGMDKEQANVSAQEILTEVELWDLRSRRAAKLSSGQKQRLAIARALAKPAPILIADEPTGNLDPENSDKVIRLLSLAARERLVILITHEFSEAENFVTRHIRLQDGNICADAQLRPAPAVESAMPQRKKQKKLTGYITRLQLSSRPMWSAMVLGFLALTAFAVFAFLGSFIVALDDTPTRIYDTSAFMNGDMERIVVVRKDGEAMTQADYDAILNLEYVTELERYGYAADVSYAYQEEVDHVFHYSLHNYGSTQDPLYMNTSLVEISCTDRYVRTVPVLKEGETFLTAGKLPETAYEVVAVGGSELLGKTMTVYLKDFQHWGNDEYIRLEVTVVGVTDRGEGLYFADDVAKMLTAGYLYHVYYLPNYQEIPVPAYYRNYCEATSGSLFHVEVLETEDSEYRLLKDDEILISFGTYTMMREYIGYWDWDPTTMSFYEVLYSVNYGNSGEAMHITGVHDSTLRNAYSVNPDHFAAVMDTWLEGWCDQVSITLLDYSYTDRVIADLEDMGYFALSPYVLGSTQVDPELAAQRSQTLGICLAALVAVALLQLLVLRALFSMEQENYRILSNIGLSWPTAAASAVMQVLLFTLGGQVLGLGGIALCSKLGVERIVSLTKYLSFWLWVLLCLVHLVFAFVSAAGVAGNLRKQVYTQSVRRSDLNLEEVEEV